MCQSGNILLVGGFFFFFGWGDFLCLGVGFIQVSSQFHNPVLLSTMAASHLPSTISDAHIPSTVAADSHLPSTVADDSHVPECKQPILNEELESAPILNAVLPELYPWIPGVAVAGGVLLTWFFHLKRMPDSDVDVWVQPQDFLAVLKRFQQPKNLIHWGEGKATIYRPGDLPPVQIIVCESPLKIFRTFDLDAVQVCYDGTELILTKACVAAWHTRTVTQTTQHTIYQTRVDKMKEKGFDVALPDTVLILPSPHLDAKRACIVRVEDTKTDAENVEMARSLLQSQMVDSLSSANVEDCIPSLLLQKLRQQSFWTQYHTEWASDDQDTMSFPPELFKPIKEPALVAEVHVDAISACGQRILLRTLPPALLARESEICDQQAIPLSLRPPTEGRWFKMDPPCKATGNHTLSFTIRGIITLPHLTFSVVHVHAV
jgi:hypothetical protein